MDKDYSVPLVTVRCARCRFEWAPRMAKVKRCANPKCRTAHWQAPPVGGYRRRIKDAQGPRR